MQVENTRPLRWLRVEAVGSSEGIPIKVTNTSSATVRILWTHTAIVGPDGQADGVHIAGQKFIEAGRPAAASVIPAGAYFSTTLVPAQSVVYVPPRITTSGIPALGWVDVKVRDGHWEHGVLPSGPVRKDLLELLEPFIVALGGKRLRLLLGVEHRGRIYALELQFTIDRIVRRKCSLTRGSYGCVDDEPIYSIPPEGGGRQ